MKTAKTKSMSGRSIMVPVYIITATIIILGISNSIASYAQTNSNNNSTGVVKAIDAGISAIKSGDNNGGKKNLLQAESALEGNPKLAGAEKHIEASIQALKDGDTNGAISHAQEAKNGLSSA
jgi:hypothetical protein